MSRFVGIDPEPVHGWFELSYSSYLVLPRSLMQSMPVGWQARMVECLEEMREAFAHLDVNDRYTVMLRGDRGRIVKDPYADYKRGRRRIDPLLGPPRGSR